MKVLITGGTGFIGSRLSQSLLDDGHQVWVLSRKPNVARIPHGVELTGWDGKTTEGWGHLVDEMDAIVNLAGKSLASWPWTKRTKQEFWESRHNAGDAVAQAVKAARHRPRVVLQASGINYYGLYGESVATEDMLAAHDYLAQLALAWEAATKPVEAFGVRLVVIRSAVVLARGDGLFPLMALPVRLFFGGRMGTGEQALPWIHIADEINAIRFLLEDEQAHGAYNLVAPEPVSNAEFMRGVAEVLHRPYWFPMPAFLMRLLLGEMSLMVLAGRFSAPKRLLESNYHFQYPLLREALTDIFN